MIFRERTIRNSFWLFAAISVLFHLSLMSLLALRWPASQAVSHPKPMFVSVIDPAELFKIPTGKETVLPQKPKDLPKGDLTALPRGMTAPQPSQLQSNPSSQSKTSKSSPSAVPELSDTRPSTTAPLPDAQPSEKPPREAASSESSSASVPQPSLTPIPKQSVPGLPFADQKELDQLAKVFTEKEMPKRDTIAINTDDLRYLTYMLGLKRRIEFVWEYPAAAIAAGIQGELLLNFTIRKDGQLTDVSLVRSSGYHVLDEEAIQALKSASPYAPLPESWHQDRITITGNFIYYGESRRSIQ
ncbi:MAG TPA: TonB family protein [Nitrospiria bacterium]|jgi:TonB family protein|nr:TonB family protein [Nitrospiria bacterium]